MYSYEISNYLSKRNNQLNPREYFDLLNNSPQVKECKAIGEDDKYAYHEIYTDDNYRFLVRFPLKK